MKLLLKILSYAAVVGAVYLGMTYVQSRSEAPREHGPGGEHVGDHAHDGGGDHGHAHEPAPVTAPSAPTRATEAAAAPAAAPAHVHDGTPHEHGRAGDAKQTEHKH